jgi:hypothetical protein
VSVIVTILLVTGLIALAYANNFVWLTGESGSEWVQYTEHYDLVFNESVREVNITSSSQWLTTGPINVTGGNATILIVAYIDHVILNYTDVTGHNITAVNTTEILEIYPLGYTVVVRANGDDVRVIFDLTEHGLHFWDSVPVIVIEPEYYVLTTLGVLLIGISLLVILREVFIVYTKQLREVFIVYTKQ